MSREEDRRPLSENATAGYLPEPEVTTRFIEQRPLRMDSFGMVGEFTVRSVPR